VSYQRFPPGPNTDFAEQGVLLEDDFIPHSRGHLIISADIFVTTTWEEDATSKPFCLAKHPTTHGTAP
jgi:hypothetical protein